MGHHGKIYGTTVIGDRGQVVIPAEAREELGIKSGEKFIVLGDPRKGSVTLVKADIMNRFADMFLNHSKKFEKIAKEIAKTTEQDEPDED